MLRLNPQSEWVKVDVPELRIIDDDLWQAVKERQAALAKAYAKQITASRNVIAKALNATHRPRTLLSGLLVCGCCGGSYARRGQDRYACMTHIRSGGCTNRRTIARERLEARVLDGLKQKLMVPEVAAEAMRAYADETNRLNRERRTHGEADRKALADIERKLKDIVAAIEDGGYTRMLSDRLRELEAQQDQIADRLAQAPIDIPDIHPNVADIYRRKVARLADALNHPEDSHEATAALRGLIERIVLTPGRKRGELHATLHDELGTIPRLRENPKTPLAKRRDPGSTERMIRPGFLDIELRQNLIELARDGSAAHRLARRANALVLLDDGMSCEAIAKVLLLDDDTIRTWYRLYEGDGIEGLTNFSYEGSACQLSGEQQEKLKAWVATAAPPRSRT